MMKNKNEEIDNEEIEEPSVEPEICGEGKDGFDCDPNWNGESWWCSTCSKYV